VEVIQGSPAPHLVSSCMPLPSGCVLPGGGDHTTCGCCGSLYGFTSSKAPACVLSLHTYSCCVRGPCCTVLVTHCCVPRRMVQKWFMFHDVLWQAAIITCSNLTSSDPFLWFLSDVCMSLGKLFSACLPILFHWQAYGSSSSHSSREGRSVF